LGVGMFIDFISIWYGCFSVLTLALEPCLDYTENMRFELIDKHSRLFQTERYCYRGSIDDWIPISGPGELGKLAASYLKHIGKDSYYEF